MKHSFLVFISICALFLVTNCSSDDNITRLESRLVSTTYALNAVTDPSIIGDARIIKNEDASITVEIVLSGIASNIEHPANLRFNTAAETGNVAISLNDVSGTSGRSTTTFTTFDDGTEVSYEELLDFDGYIDVRYNNDATAVLLADGDIGQNELTGVSKTYALQTLDVPDISGVAKFSERKNGETLARIEITNAVFGTLHPAELLTNTSLEGGISVLSFNAVDGDSGYSRTNIVSLDDGTPFLYEDILAFNGYVNVLLSPTDLQTVIAQGDIGLNALTGDSVVYPLSEVDASGLYGTATFYKREGGSALAVLALENTVIGNEHPAFIRANDVETTGDIVFTFNPVNGETGMSETNVFQLDNGTEFDYEAVLLIDGYININESTTNLDTIIAQGNIGENVDN
ncbi:hypothetical protein ACW5R3_09275 [Bizionia sp. KMM 8389]